MAARKDKQKKASKVPDGPNIWTQLAIAFAAFILLSSGYSLVKQYITGTDETVPISQIAADITAGSITSLEVRGDKITATYADPSNTSGQAKTKTSRKETESSLTE